MEIFYPLLRYLKDYILFNPIVWGIVGIILWIVGTAFLKAWRGKDED